MDTLLALLLSVNEPNVCEAARASKARFKHAAIRCGLAAEKQKSNLPLNTDAGDKAARAG